MSPVPSTLVVRLSPTRDRLTIHRRSARSRSLGTALVVIILLVQAAFAQLAPGSLNILEPERNGWIRLNAPTQANSLLLLESSPNLRDWSWFATLHDGAFAYPDAGSPSFMQ